MIFKEDVKILPLIIGEGNTKFTMLLARAISSLMEKKKGKYLIIATTNLSCEIKYKDAIVYDRKFANILLKNNPDQLAEQLAINQIKAHGGGGAVALLRLAQLSKINNIKILKLFNSGDINGEKLKVQGYISAVM